jgi:hypothetical protein
MPVEIIPPENEVFTEDDRGVRSRPVADGIYFVESESGIGNFPNEIVKFQDIVIIFSKAVEKCVAPEITIGETLWTYECRFRKPER